MKPFKATCYYCKAHLTAVDAFVECKNCENNPCYTNGFDGLSFNNILVDRKRYAITYNPENCDTKLLIFMSKGDSTGYMWKILSSMKVPQPITPSNVVEFVERCLKIKAFL